jgi:hypothetical protein
LLKVETDGDIHIVLTDATGDKPGIVVCEIPAKPQWCEIRNTASPLLHSTALAANATMLLRTSSSIDGEALIEQDQPKTLTTGGAGIEGRSCLWAGDCARKQLQPS